MEEKPLGEPTQVVSKFKLSTKVESTGHWLVEDHARIWEVLKTEEPAPQASLANLYSGAVGTAMTGEQVNQEYVFCMLVTTQ
ncbi:hypothetical protein P7K49_037676 [Saguinus oedipus]|uniref:Uncharacterized protein n=1 Tax=Saguinus oedipus TaxID=9490 RepID=A0ABQ9TIT1_SAGOE|nr:hypothetical protein P7K49_037676 [Saguinus oedipus]